MTARYQSIVGKFLLLLLLFAIPVTTISGTLSNPAWLGQENLSRRISLTIDGKELDLDDDILLITRYFQQKPFDYFLLAEKASDHSVKPSSIECAQNLKDDIYLLRPSIDEPIKLPHDLSWSENPFNDSNWESEFHIWKFASCLIDGYKHFEDEWFLNRLEWLVSDWWTDNFKRAYPSKDRSWYDHTVPRRLYRLLTIWEFLRRERALEPNFVNLVIRFVYWHSRMLMEEGSLYTPNHNHGLDQSFRLFQAATVFPEIDGANKWLDKARSRLKSELWFALRNEGVHVENSPGYHAWISGYSLKINRYAEHYTGEAVNPDYELLAENGLKYLIAITRPDRHLPQIGDTMPNRRLRPQFTQIETMKWFPQYLNIVSDGREGRSFKAKTHIFPESGYFIHRDSWDWSINSPSTHLVMSCGFLARGHRQNDDGNILLYGLSESWLIDGGIFGYSASPRWEREYVRGASAHNLSMPAGVLESRSLERKEERFANNWGLVSSGGNHATCKSHMYPPFEYTRHLKVIGARSYKIDDSLLSGEGSPPAGTEFYSLFKVGFDKSIYLNKSKKIVKILNQDRTASLSIEYETMAPVDIEVGRGADGLVKSFETIAWRKLKAAQTIIFISRGKELSIGFTLVLSKDANIDGFEQLQQ